MLGGPRIFLRPVGGQARETARPAARVRVRRPAWLRRATAGTFLAVVLAAMGSRLRRPGKTELATRRAPFVLETGAVDRADAGVGTAGRLLRCRGGTGVDGAGPGPSARIRRESYTALHAGRGVAKFRPTPDHARPRRFVNLYCFRNICLSIDEPTEARFARRRRGREGLKAPGFERCSLKRDEGRRRTLVRGRLHPRRGPCDGGELGAGGGEVLAIAAALEVEVDHQRVSLAPIVSAFACCAARHERQCRYRQRGRSPSHRSEPRCRRE